MRIEAQEFDHGLLSDREIGQAWWHWWLDSIIRDIAGLECKQPREICDAKVALEQLRSEQG